MSYPPEWSSSESVTVCGMGGSAIAGDLLSGLVAAQEGVPVRVVRGFDFPFRIDSRSLIIVCSYSGDTRETISLFHKAITANARIIVAAGGGLIAQEATRAGMPLLKVDIPGEPRSAVGYNLMLLLSALNQLGLWSISQAEVTVSLEALARQATSLEEEQASGGNPAKDLALQLHEKLIMVYGGGLFSGLARRWKTQLNENGKVWAWHEEIPELLHNAVEAYGSLPEIKKGLSAVMLRPNLEDDPAADHYQVVEELLKSNAIPLHLVQPPEGLPPLGQLLTTMMLGDYVSYYLAILQGVDPSPTPNIVLGKERLEKLGDG
ncbi:MAG: bifunctional phosphoglucose/phosphomannose isomerase [Proteobacteria bacterium]|nr:bifunctional phosphoglucose/phosphomannose isomerase [Pseudomonadota bacterium]